MKTTLLVTLFVFGLMGALFDTAWSASQASLVRKIECWDDGRKTTRITVAVDKTPTWSVTPYDSPPRVLIQFDKSQLDKSLLVELNANQKICRDINQGVVARMEAMQNGGNAVGFHIYLNGPCAPRIFDKGNIVCFDFDRPPAQQKKMEEPAKIRARKTVMTKLIVLDAGHGGEDVGCMGLYGMREKDITLNIVKMLEQIINDPKNPYFHAYLTRENDFCPLLEDRVVFANELADRGGADCLISIHCNSAYNVKATGVEIFRLSESMVSQEAQDSVRTLSKKGAVNINQEAKDMLTRLRVEDADRLAGCLLERMCGIPGFSRRAADPKEARFRVLRNLKIPGALLEIGFLSNWSDATKIRDVNVQKQVAWKVYEGLKDYFGIEAVESPKPVVASAAGEIKSLRAHKVSRGENLSTIAKNYGVSADTLGKHNGLSGSIVREGQVIQVPSVSDSAPIVSAPISESVHTVKPGDSLYSISKQYRTSIRDLRARNDLDQKGRIKPGDSLIIPERANR